MIVSSRVAHAYCRSTTCDPLEDPDACSPDERGCVTTGTPLFWPDTCVTYAVQQNGSVRRGISAYETDAIMAAAFAAWLGTECPTGGAPSIGVVPLGGARCDRAEFNAPVGGRGGAPNANLVIFRDDAWSYADEASVIARTCLTFDTQSGAILDADIEINSFSVELSTSDSLVESDLQSILTHELGHFLGLDHSTAPNSTMQEHYEVADLGARVLSSDDEAGICSIYSPLPEPISSCPTETGPQHGFSRDCGSDLSADGGCLSITRGYPGGAGGPSAVCLLTALAALRRRRRACQR